MFVGRRDYLLEDILNIATNIEFISGGLVKRLKLDRLLNSTLAANCVVT